MQRLKTLSLILLSLMSADTFSNLEHRGGASVNVVPPCAHGSFKSWRDPIPPNWKGPIFQLSQAYPDSLPAPETVPWEGIDFKHDPLLYLRAVRNYIFEGNVNLGNPNSPWVVQNNRNRKWYHAPWLDAGKNGREFINGLTRELTSVSGQLWKNPPQKDNIQNWAVGFYNPKGGYMLGRVWCDPSHPLLGPITFPDGTVTAKLFFSAAPISQGPFLQGSVEWSANINSNPNDAQSPRMPQKVRLLQIDVDVRDDNYKETGWVFGTSYL